MSKAQLSINTAYVSHWCHRGLLGNQESAGGASPSNQTSQPAALSGHQPDQLITPAEPRLQDSRLMSAIRPFSKKPDAVSMRPWPCFREKGESLCQHPHCRHARMHTLLGLLSACKRLHQSWAGCVKKAGNCRIQTSRAERVIRLMHLKCFQDSAPDLMFATAAFIQTVYKIQ